MLHCVTNIYWVCGVCWLPILIKSYFSEIVTSSLVNTMRFPVKNWLIYFY